jgi:hypothetical protein
MMRPPIRAELPQEARAPSALPAPLRRPSPHPLPSFRVVDDRSRLVDIVDDALNLVLWRRQIPEAVTRALASWSRRRKPRFHRLLEVRGYDLGHALEGLDEPDAHAWILADLALLIGILAGCSSADRLRVFFGVVCDDQCRKFHVDYLRFRLVTTYVGPGTEWIPDEAVDRAVLENPPECPHDANRRLVLDSGQVRHARAGDVLLSKGAHAVGRRRALVHRSPPIEGSGASRLVLIASTCDEGDEPAGATP